jgi:hypothetical protein
LLPLLLAATVDGIFNWIKTIVTYSEKDIQQSHGIDVLVYLQFVKFCIILFVFMTAIGMLVLLPTNYSGTNGMSGFNATCLGNLHEEDPRLWIHLCAVYLFTGSPFEPFLRLCAAIFENAILFLTDFCILVLGRLHRRFSLSRIQ